MTTEEKQILLKDLCGRLPYGVIITYYNVSEKSYIDAEVIGYSNGFIDIDNHSLNPEFVKPYLRPMSSMDVVEKEFMNNEHIDFWIREDYCNCYHFDYRGLISMGLALEAPEDMYKTV